MQWKSWRAGLLAIVLLAMGGSALAQDDPQSLRQSGSAEGDSQTTRAAPAAARRLSKTKEFDTAEVAKINAWTVGLAAGQLEGAPLRFATDISRVVDDGDNLHVLPIVTRGPTENVEALLYLKGVDVAMINADTLEQFQTKIPDIQKRITYILSLFPSELHIFVRPDINSLDDLKGKKVNFNTQGTAAAYSGPLIFNKLKLDVQKTFIPHQVAMEQMRAGTDDIEAVVFVTSKPVDAFARGKWPPGFKFLPVPFQDFTFYLPSTLTSADYPQLIPQGQEIQTIAVPTILAAFNWPKGSNRYDRVARLADHLFDRLDTLQGPGFHPKWRDVVINAQVPGLTRFRAAQEWLDRTAPAPVAVNAPAAESNDAKLFRQFLQWKSGQPQTATNARLFRDFLEWQKTH